MKTHGILFTKKISDLLNKVFTPPGPTRQAPGGWRKPGGNSVCFEHLIVGALENSSQKNKYIYQKLNVCTALKCSYDVNETDLRE